jgi:UDP-2,3-diacylglucosamine hydrolase
MSETLFISDLHLSPARPGSKELLLGFLASRARRADALYILGDLFDAWIGDDDPSPPNPEVIRGLRALADSGTRLFLMHGNRDFLLGSRFAEASGARLLSDPTVVDLYGTPTLLMHGDLLCTGDLAYQAMRAQIRAPEFVSQFLARPIPERRVIAAEYRRRSGEATSLKSDGIMDVSQDTVAQAMSEHAVERLIHGHTHRPGDHRFQLDGRPAERLVLAEWHEHEGQALRASPQGLRRERIRAAGHPLSGLSA